MSTFTIGFLLAFGVLSGMVIPACMAPNSWQSNRQSDEAMKTAYTRHRDSFAKLERLFTADPDLLLASPSRLHRVANGLPSESRTTDEYRSSFEQTGVIFGARDGVIDLEFLSFTTFRIQLDYGDFSEQSFEEKGYAYILESDEKIRDLLGTGKTYGNTEFSHIEGHWFIFHRIKVSKPE